MYQTNKNTNYKKDALKIILITEGFKKEPYNDGANILTNRVWDKFIY